jgi:mono/diheme cytochrome c family protein
MKCLLALAALAAYAICLPGQNLTYVPDNNWRAPQSAVERHNPLSANKPEVVAGGRKLFLRNCGECHGRDGFGIEKKRSADLQLRIVQEQSDGALFWKISNGNAPRGMPSWSKLPELQRWQLVLYIRTLKPSAAQ